ncbi:MAG: type II toxin-antitoxin system HicA family toxin, partial [Candidatus Dormibacteraeota bacterium]|nr:type II toxin-antitoxin system HicA family toxin [Candidatus Dormibacteraeota bacterium]
MNAPPGGSVPKASRVLAALERDGWVRIRQHGSHRTLKREHEQHTFAHHMSVELGNSDLVKIARQFGYSLAE